MEKEKVYPQKKEYHEEAEVFIWKPVIASEIPKVALARLAGRSHLIVHAWRIDHGRDTTFLVEQVHSRSPGHEEKTWRQRYLTAIDFMEGKYVGRTIVDYATNQEGKIHGDAPHVSDSETLEEFEGKGFAKRRLVLANDFCRTHLASHLESGQFIGDQRGAWPWKSLEEKHALVERTRKTGSNQYRFKDV